jgi:hypothetical protein
MDEKRIQDYLSGRLSDAEAEELEARCLADEALGAELERALEIRAALMRPGVSLSARKHRATRRVLLPLALAASAAMAGVGVYWLQAASQGAPVFRGVEQRMGLEVEIRGGELSARWKPVSGAASYELRVLENEGGVIRSVEVNTGAAAIDLRAAEPSDAGSKPAFVDVVALDEFGQTLNRSERIALSDLNAPLE